MTDDQRNAISDAWNFAMCMYNQRESVDYSTDPELVRWHVYNNEYQRWVGIWQILFHSAM